MSQETSPQKTPNSPRPESPTKKQRTSEVWTHFQEEEGKNVCNHCKKAYSTTSGVSSLRYHLENEHNIKEDKQPTLEVSFKLPLPPNLSEAIDKALLKWIVDDAQAFRVVEEPSFLNLLEALNVRYIPPTRQTVSSTIRTQGEETKQKIRNVLSGPLKLCLTSDGWTSISLRSYLAVTAHFIDQDWILRHLLISFGVVTEAHTAANLVQLLYDVLTEYGIKKKVNFFSPFLIKKFLHPF